MEYEKLAADRAGEPSAAIRARVTAARAATRSVQLGMSARSFHRVLKRARTIADSKGAEKIRC